LLRDDRPDGARPVIAPVFKEDAHEVRRVAMGP
jgi:hypothetical protein